MNVQGPVSADARMDFGSMQAIGSGLGSGGFIVYDDTACMVRVAHTFSESLHVESCGQCTPANSVRIKRHTTCINSLTGQARVRR
jgi:NADH:ubiquinone oxidoreductase subunit F (NADH-binding)